ncbi:MAG: hypothetical protein ACXW0O_00275 [Methylosarcina sp.]
MKIAKLTASLAFLSMLLTALRGRTKNADSTASRCVFHPERQDCFRKYPKT